MKNRVYICIDLKSFYASVECVERSLDPMTTNLVVADPERTDKTICLAVSPSLKALGVKNRCRVFEIPKDIKYIIAPPRMKKYIDYSASIYAIYLRYISEEDIFVYSIDEVFIDVTDYLVLYEMSPKDFALFLMDKVLKEIGIRATAGIGSNLYLAKIALDITAKHSPLFIGELDEESYKEKLWQHTPLTDFWRIGRAISRRLEHLGLYTMYQIAHTPEDILYREFGIDAEILIDHAWGRESVTLKDIQAYKPKNRSVNSSQVLSRDYSINEALVVLKEMSDEVTLLLVERSSLAKTFSLSIGYAKESGGSLASLSTSTMTATANSLIIKRVFCELYLSLVDRTKLIRRLSLTLSSLTKESEGRQLDLFLDNGLEEKDNKVQKTVLQLKNCYGKNIILKGTDWLEGATAKERNKEIGGHKSGE